MGGELNMIISEYAKKNNISVDRVLNLCHQLGFTGITENDILSDYGVSLLDKTINSNVSDNNNYLNDTNYGQTLYNTNQIEGIDNDIVDTDFETIDGLTGDTSLNLGDIDIDFDSLSGAFSAIKVLVSDFSQLVSSFNSASIVNDEVSAYLLEEDKTKINGLKNEVISDLDTRVTNVTNKFLKFSIC